MKDFVLTDSMLRMGNLFYPTGYAFVVFPDRERAVEAAQALQSDAQIEIQADGILLLTPQHILRDLARIAEEDPSNPLPPVGPESAKVAHYAALARTGAHALMLPTDSNEHTEKMMEVLRNFPLVYAQKYHLLAIEDLE